MFRRILLILSLIGFIASLGMWGLSYWNISRWTYSEDASRRSISLAHGALHLGWTRSVRSDNEAEM